MTTGFKNSFDVEARTFNIGTAKNMLEHNFKHNRFVSALHVEELANAMKLGRFMPTGTIAVAYTPWDGNGKWNLINGQQTMHAIIRSSCVQRLPFVRHYPIDENELNWLYSHYDTQRRRRLSDTFRAHGVSEKTGLTKKAQDQLAGSLRWIISGFGFVPISRIHIAPEDMLDLVHDWADEYEFIKASISPCDTDIRLRIEHSRVLSVALVTARAQPDTAEVFWRQVAQNDALNRGDPRKALNQKLLSYGGVRGRRVREVIPEDVLSRVVAHAWNKYVSGQTLLVIKENLINGRDPIKIAGTPLTGKPGAEYIPGLSPDDKIYGRMMSGD